MVLDVQVCAYSSEMKCFVLFLNSIFSLLGHSSFVIMERKIVFVILVISSFSILLTGKIISDGVKTETQHLVIQFEFSGRFELVYTHRDVSETVTKLGIHQIYVTRKVNQPWEIFFMISKLDSFEAPLFVFIKTLDGEEIFRIILIEQEGYIDLDCNSICEVTHISA